MIVEHEEIPYYVQGTVLQHLRSFLCMSAVASPVKVIASAKKVSLVKLRMSSK